MTRAAVLAFALLSGCLEAPPEAQGEGGAADASPDDRDATADDRDAASIDPSLVLWYPMDVAPDGMVQDAALDHRAVCADCPGVAEGVIGGAYEFAPNDSLSVDDSDRLRTPEGTWSMWVWFHVNASGDLVARPIPGTDFENEMEIWIEDSFIRMSSGGASLTSSTASQVDQWIHVAATWTGEQCALYLDGVQLGTMVCDAFEYESVELLIGADRNKGVIDWFFDGRLDDVRMYDRALSEQEVAALAVPSN